MGGSQPRSLSRTLEAGTLLTGLLPPHGLLSLLPYATQDHLAREAPPMVSQILPLQALNQENALQTCPQAI